MKVTDGVYTAGPWSVNVCESHNGAIAYIKADTGHYEVAVLYPNSPRQLADSQMVAAAPELYAALKAVMGEVILPSSSPALQQALSALVKAEGL